jgi:hypothetical protein
MWEWMAATFGSSMIKSAGKDGSGFMSNNMMQGVGDALGSVGKLGAMGGRGGHGGGGGSAHSSSYHAQTNANPANFLNQSFSNMKAPDNGQQKFNSLKNMF